MKTSLFSLLLFLAIAPGIRAEDLALAVSDHDWGFVNGAEFPPGGKGSAVPQTIEGKDALVLEYDFTDGGQYVGTITKVDIDESWGQLIFRVKADRELWVTVRLIDASSQTFQTRVRYDDASSWKVCTVDLLQLAQSYHFGGADDGAIHYPIRQLGFSTEKDESYFQPGKLEISDIVLSK